MAEYIALAPAVIAAPTPKAVFIATAPAVFAATEEDSDPATDVGELLRGLHCPSDRRTGRWDAANIGKVVDLVSHNVSPGRSVFYGEAATQVTVFVGQAPREGRGGFSVPRCGDTLYFQRCSGRCFGGTCRLVRAWHCRHSGCRVGLLSMAKLLELQLDNIARVIAMTGDLPRRLDHILRVSSGITSWILSAFRSDDRNTCLMTCRCALHGGSACGLGSPLVLSSWIGGLAFEG